MYPDSDANTFSVGQILTLAGSSYKEIREDGAIFKGIFSFISMRVVF